MNGHPADHERKADHGDYCAKAETREVLRGVDVRFERESRQDSEKVRRPGQAVQRSNSKRRVGMGMSMRIVMRRMRTMHVQMPVCFAILVRVLVLVDVQRLSQCPESDA